MDRRRSSTPAGMTMLNTITPCAACKLLRRRCTQECAFSPYFPPHEPQKFAAVHKVFGASNVSKLLMVYLSLLFSSVTAVDLPYLATHNAYMPTQEVAETQRADAANSLVIEANLRIRDPVHGCMGAISILQQQIQILQGELETVRDEILKYKHRKATGCQIIASSSAPWALASSVASTPQAQALPPPLVISSCSSSSSSIYNPAAGSIVYSSTTDKL